MPAPNLKEIENGIYELEHEESSRSGYALLAALYTCRDYMLRDTQPEARIAAYSEMPATAATPLDQYGDSDFLQAVAGKEQADAWAVMDELMDTLRVVNAKAYDSVMRKLIRL